MFLFRDRKDCKNEIQLRRTLKIHQKEEQQIFLDNRIKYYKSNWLLYPDTCTISLMKLKPPGPIMEPARRYPVMTCHIILSGYSTCTRDLTEAVMK